ncbi:hypothetical protein F5J12DRAFT_962910 [Pisolithus orientalis]|uniref:uncharacterized protein n=1 Tax=Pisolithus orientalis TaxID=936130 RepID=UPI002225AA23|nr:uncharacterized protein F5J12DRAFT_962910 [Pisolithus orientalis]KAI5993767.1 hypothetical protein F5J12DRAFT_962910 [Pisolithus orientalis]
MQASSDVYSIVVSQDGRWIVSGEIGQKAIIWNAATHEKVLEITEHEHCVFAVDISCDCSKIATVDAHTAKIFSITSGKRLLPPLPHDWVLGVKFSPDGSRLATASYDHGIRVYSADNGDILFDSGLEGSTGSLSATQPLVWSSDSQQLFVAGRGKITCFDLSKSSSAKWSIHPNQSDMVSIVSNGRFIACSAGSSVSLWDCVSHKQISGIISHAVDINCVALSPSGEYLVCVFDGVKITIHNLGDVLPTEYFGHCVSAHPLTTLASLTIITLLFFLRNALIRGQFHTYQLPLVQVTGKTLKSWTQDNPTNTEMLLSKEIASASSPSHYALANRALIRAHLKHFAPAMGDAKEVSFLSDYSMRLFTPMHLKSLQVQPSPIGYIAMAVALLGQGNREGALCTFALAFHDCELHDIRFLLLLKFVLLFESGHQAEVITRVNHLVARASDDDTIYLYTQACASRDVLGVMCMKEGNYGRAIRSIEHAKNLVTKDRKCPPLETITLIFGWDFNGPDIAARRRLCENLYAEERTAEAVEILLSIIRTSDEETHGSKATTDWIADFTKKCIATLEHFGDEAFESAKHDDAITQYSTALSLRPPSPAGLLIKQSRARAAKGLWEDALQDANEAVKVDPSDPWGYEAKHVALHGAKQYDEAINTFSSMLRVIVQSNDPAIRQLRKNFISPSETIAAIDAVIRETLKDCPLVVIDITTGCLCDGPERIRIFKADSSFKELVSSMTREADKERILRVIAKFFGYVMFSHAWQGTEPSFRDVNVVKSVWNLPDTPLNEKLRNFCLETRRLGHNWAWSDTCCIDKSASSILVQSLTSMYKWYANSAATLVYLAGVAHPSKPGDLTRSFWMTRAWTLQELLSPRLIFFYDSEWKPYLGISATNHKKSLEIMQELADTIKIPCGMIVTFSPNDLGVHEKLRLASTRNATVEEDVAYSLIGIFKSDIRPHYGEGPDALGHLLEEIVARSGEVSVLAWSGKSSSYNSCLPASISVYNQTLHNPPPLEGEEMKRCIAELREKLSQREAQSIYRQINSLSPARFATRCLHLPCIVFSVKYLCILRGNQNLYSAWVSGLGQVEFTATDNLPVNEPKKFVFAHPWIHYIRGPSSGFTWGGDSESDIDSDSDGVVPPSSLHAAPTPRVDGYTQALEMIARLGKPFNALLLVQQPNGEYKRVATETEIVVSGLGTNITPRNIRTKVLEIL